VTSRTSSSLAIRLLTVALLVLASSQVVMIARLVRAEATIRELRDATGAVAPRVLSAISGSGALVAGHGRRR
jgi:hypothetical protein